MKRLGLLAILVVLAVASLRAQEEPNSPDNAPIINPSAPEQSPLTDRQKAELRAQILMARKEYEEAVKAYDRLLKEAPNDARLLNQRGIAYEELGELGEAEHSYKQAVHADKNFTSAINNLGALEYSRKHYRKAIKYYTRAIARPDGDRAVIYSNLGYAYFGNRQYKPAMVAFRQALAIDPDVFQRKSGAGTIIQERSAPDPGLLYFLVAKSYAKAGDAEHAAHYLKVSRDDGYKDFTSAKTDPDFARVIHDRRVQEVFQLQPVFSGSEKSL